MSEFIPEFLGRLLLPFADLSSIDHHIVFVGLAIDANRPKRKCIKA
jgi:hypothetical protein